MYQFLWLLATPSSAVTERKQTLVLKFTNEIISLFLSILLLSRCHKVPDHKIYFGDWNNGWWSVKTDQNKKKTKKNTARKFKAFTEKNNNNNNKSKKTTKHFSKFSDIFWTVSMNRKMCFWRHCLYIYFFFQLKKKPKWNENLFRVNT